MSARPATYPRAVLWDMDGTLVDSAHYHWLAWRETVAREGRELTHEEFAATFGQRNDIVIRGFLGPNVPDSEIERIADAKEARYRDLVRASGVQLLPGVKRWLEILHTTGWRQALATSAPHLNVEAILAALGIRTYLDGIVHGDEVSRGKPDPQVYLLAAARVSVPPAHCVVVEDASAGIEGARRAGMHSIGVGPAFADLPADLRVRTLADLPDDAFEHLVRGR